MSRSALRLVAALALVGACASDAAEANGYVSSRSQFTNVRATGLVPSDEMPRWSELLELNGQVRHSYAERGLVYADVSLFGQLAFDFRGRDANGNEIRLEPPDSQVTRPLVSINELYLSQDVVPALNVLVGKKRVVWGTGLAFNPTDLLNPMKDPTDPSLQRAGAWMAQIEVPLERFTFSLLASPQITAQASGIPYRIVRWPRWDARDDQSHWLAAARVYALVADADFNLMLFYGNRHPDAFEDKLRAGFSFSRYFAEVNELHLEALLQTGSPRSRVNAACVRERPSALQCAAAGTPLAHAPDLGSDAFLPRVLVGGRHHFDDESLLSIEYLYQADGYSPTEMQDLISALALAREARSMGLPVGQVPFGSTGTSGGEGGIPNRFRFEPLARHYLFLTFQKPKIREDFMLAITVLASLQDFSGLTAPSLTWGATDWLTLTASAFVPFPGPRRFAAVDPATSDAISEYGLPPLLWRTLLEARIFY